MSTVDQSGDLHVTGRITCGSMTIPDSTLTNASVASNAAIARSKLAQDALKPYPVHLTNLRVWDAPQSPLPTAAADDDLGLIAGTFGSAAPTVQTIDAKTTSTTAYARFFFMLPAEYDAAQTIICRLSAGMLTTVADVQAIVDMHIYKHDREGGVSADLCGTAFQNINSLTFADFDFEVTNTGLAAGDVLDCRIYVYVEDASTGTAVKGCIGAVEMLCDVKG